MNKTKKSILIVEDNLINARLLAEYLKRKEIDYLLAYDGETAVQCVKENKDISLVLMDIGLPKMSGEEAMNEIKKMRTDLPVIAQTAYTFSDSEEEFLEAGFDDYLSKPINFYVLDKMLSKYYHVSYV